MGLDEFFSAVGAKAKAGLDAFNAGLEFTVDPGHVGRAAQEWLAEKDAAYREAHPTEAKLGDALSLLTMGAPGVGIFTTRGIPASVVERARNLFGEGKKSREIWDRTGTLLLDTPHVPREDWRVRGPFREIPNKTDTPQIWDPEVRPVVAALKAQPPGTQVVGAPMGDILSMPEVYGAVPELKDMQVRLFHDPGNKAHAWFSHPDKDINGVVTPPSISLNTAYLPTPRALFAGAMHEGQHGTGWLENSPAGYSRAKAGAAADPLLRAMRDEIEQHPDFKRFRTWKNLWERLAHMSIPGSQSRELLEDWLYADSVGEGMARANEVRILNERLPNFNPKGFPLGRDLPMTDAFRKSLIKSSWERPPLDYRIRAQFGMDSTHPDSENLMLQALGHVVRSIPEGRAILRDELAQILRNVSFAREVPRF